MCSREEEKRRRIIVPPPRSGEDIARESRDEKLYSVSRAEQVGRSFLNLLELCEVCIVQFCKLSENLLHSTQLFVPVFPPIQRCIIV